MTRPCVFVSSTCYDLKQLRADMCQSIEALGLEPVLSEYNTFPVRPEAATIENCIEVVKTKADIFVLIIGGRYGSATADGRSITNREYLSARVKGIPIYAFVKRSILDILPVWQDNPDGDFSRVVDSSQLFEFVAELRDGGEQWVLPFDTAQDIYSALRIQFAYLFRDALQLRLRTTDRGAFFDRYRHLSAKELRVLIERPSGWEYLLWAAATRREFEALADAKRDWRYRIVSGPTRVMKPSEFLRWAREKNDELMRLVGHTNELFREPIQVALGPPGVSGDPDAILYVANRFASVYSNLLKWKLDFLCVSLPDEYRELKRLGSCLADNAVNEIEHFEKNLEMSVQSSLRQATAGVQTVLELQLTITLGDTGPFEHELNRLSELAQTGQLKWV